MVRLDNFVRSSRISSRLRSLPLATALLVLVASIVSTGPSFAIWFSSGVRSYDYHQAGVEDFSLKSSSPSSSSSLASSLSAPGFLGLFAASACVALGFTSARAKSATTKMLTQRKGWGDDVTFHDASVKENVEAAEGLRLITIEAPPDVTEPFKRPGQYVQAKASPQTEKASFYAISSPPSSGGQNLEFLIKNAESNEWLTGSNAGDSIQLSSAMGKGFALDCEAWQSADVNQVSLFATGSGISPMRSAIESSDALNGKVCRLYYGARTESSLAFADKFDDWRKKGIEVVPCLSQGGNSWTGRCGYVQTVMQEDEERGEGFVLAARHGALLCGQKEMVQAVRAFYADLGVPEERTLMNF